MHVSVHGDEVCNALGTANKGAEKRENDNMVGKEGER